MQLATTRGTEMKINSKDFRVPAGEKVNLKKWPTRVKPVYKSKKEYTKLLQEHVEELSSLQRLHYASNRYAVLLIFQAMDAAGKDGAIRHVMSGVNPQGCQVFSFKHPSADGTGSRLSVAHHPISAGARPHRHLQPFLLRGSADRSGASGDPAHPRVAGQVARRENCLARRGIAPSWTWKTISTVTEHESSSFSSTFRRRNSESAFSNASMNRTRTGNSVLRTFERENSGSSTWRRMRRA